jgi:hypothetical protein
MYGGFAVLAGLFLVGSAGFGLPPGGNPLSRRSDDSSALPERFEQSKKRPVGAGGGAWEIKLNGRRFTPPEGVDSTVREHVETASGKTVHLFIQFYENPDSSARSLLQDSGVTLLKYVPNRAWFSSVEGSIKEEALKQAGVRWVGTIRPEDKVFHMLLKRGAGLWARNNDGTINVEVSFFRDVPLPLCRKIMEKAGATVKKTSPASHSLTIRLKQGMLMEIAAMDEVRWIIEERPPMKKHLRKR